MVDEWLAGEAAWPAFRRFCHRETAVALQGVVSGKRLAAPASIG